MFTYWLTFDWVQQRKHRRIPQKTFWTNSRRRGHCKEQTGWRKGKALDDFIWQDFFGTVKSIFILVAFSVFAVSTCTSNVSESKHTCLSNYRSNVLVRKHTDILDLDCFGDTRVCCYRYKQHHINTVSGRSCDPFLLDNPKRKTDNSHVDVSMTLLPFLNRFEEALPSALFLGDHVWSTKLNGERDARQSVC